MHVPVTLGLALYWLGLRLGLKPWVSALLTAWFMVSPATVLYESLYFYTYLIASLLVLAAWMLIEFLKTNHFWRGLGFFSAIAALCLAWAIFHLVWMIAAIVLAAIFSRDRRRLVLASLLPVLLVLGWYAKNEVLFGSFGASSWAGMNLSHVTFFSPLTSPAVREELVKQGVISPYPLEEAFRSIDLSSYKEAAEYLHEVALPDSRIGVVGTDMIFKPYAHPDLRVAFFNGVDIGEGFNYVVISSRANNDLAICPNAKVIKAIERDGAVLTSVKQITSPEDCVLPP